MVLLAITNLIPWLIISLFWNNRVCFCFFSEFLWVRAQGLRSPWISRVDFTVISFGISTYSQSDFCHQYLDKVCFPLSWIEITMYPIHFCFQLHFYTCTWPQHIFWYLTFRTTCFRYLILLHMFFCLHLHIC